MDLLLDLRTEHAQLDGNRVDASRQHEQRHAQTVVEDPRTDVDAKRRLLETESRVRPDRTRVGHDDRAIDQHGDRREHEAQHHRLPAEAAEDELPGRSPGPQLDPEDAGQQRGIRTQLRLHPRGHERVPVDLEHIDLLDQEVEDPRKPRTNPSHGSTPRARIALSIPLQPVFKPAPIAEPERRSEP